MYGQVYPGTPAMLVCQSRFRGKVIEMNPVTWHLHLMCTW